VNYESWRERMEQAGADFARSPYLSYGMTLASAAVSSVVLDLHHLPLLGVGTEEIVVPESSPLVGSTVADIHSSHPFAYIVGLRREDRLSPWYGVEGPIQGGDVLVALGAPDHLAALATSAEPMQASVGSIADSD
jgi:Trk K+ transport system NAD-binding subunit